MAQALTPGILLALAVVVAVIFGSYWLVKHQEGRPRRSRPRRTDDQLQVERAGPAASPRAANVIADVRRLHLSQAGWSDILVTLNPNGNRALASELEAIRAPHMFAPQLALQVIEHGCAEALRKDPDASAYTGFFAAREDMEKVTRYGD